MRQLRDRNTELKSILRYGTKDEWYPVFYRPDLLIHTTRVFWITREICKYLKHYSSTLFSEELALEMAKFHDDTEILAGDIISVKKAEFTAEEKKLYEEKCLKAIDILSEIYSGETPLNYREILLKEHHAEGIEYHIVMYADKLDAHMEVTHEILAGNDIFLEPLHRWNVDTHSFDHTKMKAKRLLKKLEEVFDIPLINTNKLFHIDQDVDIDTLNKQGSPFTSDCLGEKTGYILYDTWKDLHLQYGNTSEKEYLYTQKEFT